MGIDDFSDLQPGDRTIVQYGYNGSWSTLTVIRLTKTQIITETAHGTEVRFKFDGRMIGGPQGSSLHRIDDRRAVKAIRKDRVITAAHRIITEVEKIRRDLDQADTEALEKAYEAFKTSISAYLEAEKSLSNPENS